MRRFNVLTGELGHESTRDGYRWRGARSCFGALRCCATRAARRRWLRGTSSAFPRVPDGAHKLTNDSAEPVRVIMLSTTHEPAIAVYPDSGKIGTWPPGKLFREADAVDYWEGEASGPS